MNTKLNFNVVFISNLILTLNVKTGKLLTTVKYLVSDVAYSLFDC